ncbi:MAG TPA: ABC transporter permease, partial [Gemmatimonadaceae bacterium]
RLVPRFSALDFRLGLRMLARYPGLTAVATVAIAVAVGLGSAYFEGVDKFLNPRLDIPGGDRVVSLFNWDVKRLEVESRAMHDFAIWRAEIKSVDNLGASNAFTRNLATEDGRVEPVLGAELTANAFSLMGTRPLLGRTLVDRDESPAEPLVVVIGERVWKTRFDSDPAVLGKTVKVGTESATIVGVMPEAFAFPYNQRLWMPLRATGVEPGTGPRIRIFGRLAPGASMQNARAELGVIGARLSASNPQTHQNLRPFVTAYSEIIAVGGEGRFFTNLLYLVNTIFLVLLAIMCTNVATLVFARTATRSWEITVRSALGASRGRIIGQLFSEALVLASVGTIVGLMLSRVALRFALAQIAANDSLPFWVDASLSWRTILYAAGLTIFGAAIVGILPALRVTRLNIQDMLRSEGHGRAGLKFGGFWTAVIIVQVAVTVAFIPVAADGVFKSNRFNERARAIAAEQYLAAQAAINRDDLGVDSAAYAARVRSSFDELERRLSAEPGVEHVAFADRLPIQDQLRYGFGVDTLSGAPPNGLRVSAMTYVSRGYFGAFGTSIIAGRDFRPFEYERLGGPVLIVNETFARNVFGRSNPIGQRVRLLSYNSDETLFGVDKTQWLEVVGVVKDFGWRESRPEEQSVMYRPTLPGGGPASSLVVRVRDPNAFASRLRTIAAEVDPRIGLTGVQRLGQVGGEQARINWTLTAVAWLVSFIVLLLSASGIHALMSFTVSRRTREIGIRAALGAHHGRLVAAIFSRAFLQIGAGIVIGSGIASLRGFESSKQVMLLITADAIMLVVGLVACAVPVRRALRVDPMEALRAE